MKLTEEIAKKVLFCGLVLAVFMKMFMFSWELPWQSKYQLFSVPAFEYPGGDSRNIQMAAHCSRKGVPYYGANECLESAKLVREHHPKAIVPVLNYPSLWVDAYSFFKDDSERFFMGFWSLNALLLVAGIALLCFRYNYLALPLFLFSPITLLAIERGNTDATTFFFTFVPLVAFAFSKTLQSFFLGFAAALKIFPIFGYATFLRRQPPFVARDIILGAALAVPLMAWSFLDIPHILDGTDRSFVTSYGLASLKQAPYLRYRLVLAYMAMAGFIVFSMTALFLFLTNEKINATVNSDLATLSSNELTIFAVSASIYVFTFLTFTSYAYRLIFVIPAFLIISRAKSAVSKIACVNILLVFWIPFAPYGWYLQNLACFSLAILLSYLLIRCIDFNTRLAS